MLVTAAFVLLLLFKMNDAYIKTPTRKLYMAKDMFEEAAQGKSRLSKDSIVADRYIATNRFKVRNDKGPKFEKRWAERKSRLAQLTGFRFFSLLRRVDGPGSDYSKDNDFGNYISLTVWKEKSNFDEWRTGDAFKEAHGGGGTKLESITGFIKLLTTALFILDGGPKPAFYDGLLPAINFENSNTNLDMDGGWRKVAANGENFISPDSFLVQNKFTVKEEKETAFEMSWRGMKNDHSNVPGFVGFYLLRRDADKADDGVNYISTSVWRNRESFDAWKASENSIKDSDKSFSHCPNCNPVSTLDSMLESPSKIAYYEGKLTIYGEKAESQMVKNTDVQPKTINQYA